MKELDRFRVHQHIPSRVLCVIYQSGARFRESYLFVLQTLAPLRLLAQRADFDPFFVYREAFPIGPPVTEWRWHSQALRDAPWFMTLTTGSSCEERYSLDIHAPKTISVFQEAVGQDRCTR